MFQQYSMQNIELNKKQHNTNHTAGIGCHFPTRSASPHPDSNLPGYPFKQISHQPPQKGDFVIRSDIQKQQINAQMQNNKFIANEYKEKLNLFINRYNLVIYCISCKKQIFDFYQSCSSQKDKKICQSNKIMPHKIREYFLEQVNEENLFSSNLEFPKSFQKQKKNCAILISKYRNSFLTVVIRFLASIPTISLIAERVNVQKLSSKVFKEIINCINLLNSGKYRALKIQQIEQTFFQSFPQFLSYEKHNPIDVIFAFFKLIEKQLGWKDVVCEHKQIIYTERSQWDLFKKQITYSPLKEMLMSRCSSCQQCSNCQNVKITESHSFECLLLQPSVPSLHRKKFIQLDIIKGIQQSFSINHKQQKQKTSSCKNCHSKNQRSQKTIIQPGNYMLFQIQQSQVQKIIIPKQFNLEKLNPQKCSVQEKDVVYQFVASIYKENDNHVNLCQEFGIAIDHIQIKKYMYFSNNGITESENIILEKKYKILLYKRKRSQKMLPIIKNIKSTLYLYEQGELIIQNPVPLPDFYDVYLYQHNKILPLLNPLICSHSNINFDVKKMTKTLKINYIPFQIYNFLVDQFGGRRLPQDSSNKIKQCQLCRQGLIHLQKIKTVQKQVMKYVDSIINNKKGKTGKVLVYKTWLEKWKSYLYEKSRQNYTVWGNAPPLAIDNYLGMKDKNPKTIDQTKYCKISVQVWLALSKFHSGGPQISLKRVSPSSFIRDYINIRYEQTKPIFVALIKYLSLPVRKILIGGESALQSVIQETTDILDSDQDEQKSQRRNSRSKSKSRSKSRSISRGD